MDQGFANYLQRANQAISDYADKERVEMQFLSSIGRIQASSTSNLTVGTRPGTEDISRAVETNRISYFRGADPKTGEQILAVSHPLTVNGKVVGVLRFVTSLRQVNVQVRMTVLAVVLVALQVLWLLWAFWSFTAGRVWLNGALKALSILIVLYLVRKDENSAYKIGWIVLIGLLPLLGGALYLAFGNKAPAKYLRERMQKVEQAHQTELAQPEGQTDALDISSRNLSLIHI